MAGRPPKLERNLAMCEDRFNKNGSVKKNKNGSPVFGYAKLGKKYGITKRAAIRICQNYKKWREIQKNR